jgi:hypothetical protein
MGYDITFVFRGKICTCTAYLDCGQLPVYIFIILKDQCLIEEYSDELTIKTDFHKVLPRTDDTASLVELRQAIFNALLGYHAFNKAKRAYLAESI